VVERKMAEHEKSSGPEAGMERDSGAETRRSDTAPKPVGLGYQKLGENYRIIGSAELKKAHWDLLERFYSPIAKALVVTPEQLGHLISRFEELKVRFKDLDQREPGE
jgi:hypothetical protein